MKKNLKAACFIILIMWILTLMGCAGGSGKSIDTVTYLGTDGTIDRVETNERSLTALTVFKDIDFEQFSWGEVQVDQYSGEVSPELAKSIESIVSGIIKSMLLDPEFIGTVAKAVGGLVK